MYPLGHLAVAYLCYATYAKVTEAPRPQGLPLLTLAFASQLPDLVDKPLVYLDVIASGRSLGHSLLIVVPVLLLAWWAVNQTTYREIGPALVIGVFAHLLGDTYQLVLTGDWAQLQFLLWPIFPAIDYPSDSIAPWVRLLNRNPSPYMQFEYFLAGLALMIWLHGQYHSQSNS